MNEIGIGRRYVRALFELALEAGGDVPARVGADLERFESLRRDPELSRMLEDPRVAPGDKKRALAALLPADLTDLGRDFLLWVTEKGRAEILCSAAAEYGALLREHQGVEVADVTSAAPLPQDSLEELKRSLESTTGKKVELRTHLDPRLLGGMRIKIGSRLYDGSLRRSLEQIEERLLGVRLPEPAPLALED